MSNNEKIHFDKILHPLIPYIKKMEEELVENLSNENNIIKDMAKYALFSHGKRIRPSFVFLFAQIINKEISSEHYLLAQATELIHIASLIHDDIIDNSEKRHNKPSVYKKWGINEAIIGGDFLLAKALMLLAKIENTDLITLFSNILQELCNGEIQQLSQKKDIPSLEEIVEKSKRKTAMLYIAAVKGSLLISGGNKQEIDKGEQFAKNFGIAYQITDDILPYYNNYEEKSKLSDFENQIFTPITYFAYQQNNNILNIKDYKEFLSEVKKTDAIEKTNRLASQYINRAIDSLTFFEDNNAKNIISDLTKYLSERII